MPSPRPLNLGVWKILLFPQHLHDGIFSFIILIGYVFEPIVCFLLWVPIVRNYVCNLFVFICFSLLSLAQTLAWLPLSLLGWLLAIPNHMSWFSTAVTDDFPSGTRLPLSFPPIILHMWFWLCLFFCPCESGPCTSRGCIHGIWISMGWCDPLPLLLWLWSHSPEIIDLILRVDISFLCLECFVLPLFIHLWIFVHVYEIIHFAR
jgi:hypothetical protein